ncbi:hypothetical protein [Streptomyces palmae]|uniref:hypothetical protein n=1 Tax=Streptomyces palmae TaxID=1701085 RepID=UPI001AE0D6B4|nr:hypothetical protein [Streptomyces palmae]
MAGQRWWTGGWRAARGPVLSCVLLAATLTGCGDQSAETPDRADIQRMLDRRAAAVRDKDAAAFLATVDPGTQGYRAGQRRVFGNLAKVPLRSWSYRLGETGGFRPVAGPGHRIAARVELRYRITGYDTVPVVSSQYLTLVRRSGHWYVAADGGRRGAPQQLWDQGTVRVVRGRHSLVLGVGQDPTRLRAIARTADTAVPAVAGAWGESWAGRVVVQVPSSLDRMAALLGADSASGYRGIAAVTTGEVGGAGAAPADRVIVNPEAYPVLGDLGRQVVMTHEAAHVATRAYTTESTPLWLSEGFADWVAYRDTGRTPRDIAPELARAVDGGEPPLELPRTEDFRFGTDPDALARAYEEGWLACRMIADRWGEQKLVDLYRAVGTGPARDRTDALNAALLTVLRVEPGQFRLLWRAYVAQALSEN